MAIYDYLPKILRPNRRKLEVISSGPPDTDTFASLKSSAASAAVHDDTTSSTFLAEPVGTSDLALHGDQDYTTLLGKYSRASWVYIALNRITDAVSQVNFRVVDKRKKGEPNDAVVRGQGLVDLIQRPNPWMSHIDFFELAVQHLILTGNVFIEKAEVDSRGRPKELYILNPKNMTVIPHKKNFVAGYKYTVNKQQIRFGPDDIIHIKLPDPRGESHYGLSRIAAARSIIEADWNARDWQASYFKNATWPSGIIVSEESMSETEFRRMKRELRQNYEGKSKVGKVLVLEGGLTWTQTTPNPKDLDFLNLLMYSRGEVLAMMGVPPSIAGIFEFENATSRSAGVREQSIQFWSSTVQPLVNRILAQLNPHLSSLFSENYEIVPDISKIPALKETAEMMKLRADSFSTLIGSGWSLNSALSELYPEHTGFEWGDIPLPGLGLNGERDQVSGADTDQPVDEGNEEETEDQKSPEEDM